MVRIYRGITEVGSITQYGEVFKTFPGGKAGFVALHSSWEVSNAAGMRVGIAFIHSGEVRKGEWTTVGRVDISTGEVYQSITKVGYVNLSDIYDPIPFRYGVILGAGAALLLLL